MAAANTDKMERFAFDVFLFTMDKFKLKTVIPPAKCSENTYEQPDIFPVISRGLIAFQLEKRDAWKFKFEIKSRSHGLKKFRQISELLEEMLERMDRKPNRNPIGRTITSLALINDLIQFLYSKNYRLYLNDLASFWRKNYFSHFDEEFEKHGGLRAFYLIHTEESFVALGEFIDDFIPKYCHPYGRMGISNLFNRLALQPEFVVSITKAIIDKDESGLTGLESRLGQKLSISKSSRRSGYQKTKASASLQNTGLGIRPHEEMLQDTHSLPGNEGTSSEIGDKVFTEGSVASADVKLHRKLSGQPGREQAKESGELSAHITSPKRQSGDRADLIGSPLGLGGQSKGREGSTSSTESPQKQKYHGSSQSTPERSTRLEQKRLKHILKQKSNPKN